MPRRLRFFGLLMTFGLVFSACTWPMFGFGPNHARVNPVISPLNTSNVGTMILKGTGATRGSVVSSPAVVPGGIVNGRLTGVVYVGSLDGKLYAFDQFGGTTNCTGTPKTCTPLWTGIAGSGVGSSPAMANGVVYVGSDDHQLYAFDSAGSTNRTAGPPKTCTALWTGTTGGLVASSPVVSNGVVYVGSFDSKLYAFDAAGTTNCTAGPPKTCSPLWTATTNGSVFSSPAVASGIVYVGSADHHLYAFDAAARVNCTGGPPTRTCLPLWAAATDSEVRSSPAIANGMVYVRTADTMYAFDATGTVNCTGGPPTKTCTPLWTGTTGPIELSSPAIENGIVFIGSIDGNLYAFDATGRMNCFGGPPTKTCTALWAGTTTANVAVSSSPAPAGTVVYIGSNDGKLYAFGLPQP